MDQVWDTLIILKVFNGIFDCQGDVRECVLLLSILRLWNILDNTILIFVEVYYSLCFFLFKARTQMVLLQSSMEVFIALYYNMRWSVTSAEINNVEALESTDFSIEYVDIGCISLSYSEMVIIGVIRSYWEKLALLRFNVFKKNQGMVETTGEFNR